MGKEEMTLAQKREVGMGLYTKGNMSQKEIAALLSISDKTIGEWRKKFEWDDAKKIQQVTRKSLLENAYKQLAAINKKVDDNGGIPSKIENDAKIQCLREIDLFSATPTRLYIDVFEDFMAWLSKNEPKQLQTISALALKFVEHKEREGAA